MNKPELILPAGDIQRAKIAFEYEQTQFISVSTNILCEKPK
jgi:collagenase-like PrtC family protease